MHLGIMREPCSYSGNCMYVQAGLLVLSVMGLDTMMTFSFAVTPSRCMEVLSELFEVQLYLELQVKFLFYTSMVLSVYV